jgi:acetyl esterase
MRAVGCFAIRTAGAAIVACLVHLPVSAQPCAPLNVRNPEGNYIVPGVKGDIAYSGDLALDAYVQRGRGRRPSVVVVHGGAWSSGSRAAHVGQILELLTQAGYNWFSVDYRLGGRHEDSVADIRAALRFIRCRARELDIDPDRLLLLGEDSGADLTALLAAERPAGVIGAVLIGGSYELTAMVGSQDPTLHSDEVLRATTGCLSAHDVEQETRRSGGRPSFTPDLLASCSPSQPLNIPNATPSTPFGATPPSYPNAPKTAVPVLVVHGTADTDVPIDRAQRYCRGIEQGGGRCRLVEVGGASHRSENWWPSQWAYKRDVVSWLSSVAPVPADPHQPYAGTALRKNIIYSKARGLKLDAFVQRTPEPVPAVIVVHGGGWEAGDKATYVTPLFEPLARAGLAWFSIDYRLTPASTHQDQLADLREAIRFVRAEHARFNIDPARVILVGESASGQMVAQIATEDSDLAGAIAFYGVYDLPAMVTDASPRSLLVRLFRRDTLDDDARKLLRQYSPLYQAHGKMPPLLLINGTGERLWAQAQAFAQRLTAVGARHELIALDGAPHGLENWEGHAEWTTYKRRMIEWIGGVVR